MGTPHLVTAGKHFVCSSFSRSSLCFNDSYHKSSLESQPMRDYPWATSGSLSSSNCFLLKTWRYTVAWYRYIVKVLFIIQNLGISSWKYLSEVWQVFFILCKKEKKKRETSSVTSFFDEPEEKFFRIRPKKYNSFSLAIWKMRIVIIVARWECKIWVPASKVPQGLDRSALKSVTKS